MVTLNGVNRGAKGRAGLGAERKGAHVQRRCNRVCVTCQSTALDRPMSSGEESNFLSHGDSVSAMTDNLSGETVNAIIDGVVAKLREAPRFTM